jgi:hypothetical protein
VSNFYNFENSKKEKFPQEFRNFPDIFEIPVFRNPGFSNFRDFRNFPKFSGSYSQYTFFNVLIMRIAYIDYLQEIFYNMSCVTNVLYNYVCIYYVTYVIYCYMYTSIRFKKKSFIRDVYTNIILHCMFIKPDIAYYAYISIIMPTFTRSKLCP